MRRMVHRWRNRGLRVCGRTGLCVGVVERIIHDGEGGGDEDRDRI